MKAQIIFMALTVAIACQAQTPLVVKKTVRASDGDYPLTQLQQAINDGRTYQDGVACVPYIIEIEAGQTVIGNFLLDYKDCQQYLTVQSSNLAALPVGRIDPVGDPLQRAALATIKNPAGSAVQTIATVGGRRARWYAFHGLEIGCQSPCSQFNIFQIGSLSVPDGEASPSLKPSNFWIDQCWIHGNYEESPNQALIVSGVAIIVENNRIEGAQSTFGDSQAVLVINAWNVKILNNYLDSASENVFSGFETANIEIRGNHLRKNPHYKFSSGPNPPTASCAEGERYSQLTQTYDASTTIQGAGNNGSGLIRITKNNHGYSTGDSVQAVRSLGIPGALGWYTITVVDPNHFDLQGSVFSGGWNGGGSVLKGVNRFECDASGQWAVSTNTGFDWRVKNNWEIKGTAHHRTWGNIMENAWNADQYQTAILNNVEPPYTISDVEYFANLGLNSPSAFHMGNGGYLGFPRGITRVNIHDNVWPNLGIPFQRGATCVGSVIGLLALSWNADHTINNYLTDIAFQHNTSIMRADCPDGGYMMETSAGTFKGYAVFADNFLSVGHQSLQAFDAPGTYVGWCSMDRSVDNQVGGVGSAYLLSKNILSGVEQHLTGVTTGSGPCVQQNRFPADHTFFSDQYSDKFQDASSADVKQWDYHCKSTYAPCKNAGTDGKDIGANIDLLGWATQNVVSGVDNPFFRFALKAGLPGRDVATLGFTAPSVEPCTMIVSANPNYSSPVFNHTDAGGDPERSVSLTGLIPSTLYFEKVTCGPANYVWEQTFLTTP